jgi:hypothetical protein
MRRRCASRGRGFAAVSRETCLRPEAPVSLNLNLNLNPNPNPNPNLVPRGEASPQPQPVFPTLDRVE